MGTVGAGSISVRHVLPYLDMLLLRLLLLLRVANSAAPAAVVRTSQMLASQRPSELLTPTKTLLAQPQMLLPCGHA